MNAREKVTASTVPAFAPPVFTEKRANEVAIARRTVRGTVFATTASACATWVSRAKTVPYRNHVLWVCHRPPPLSRHRLPVTLPPTTTTLLLPSQRKAQRPWRILLRRKVFSKSSRSTTLSPHTVRRSRKMGRGLKYAPGRDGASEANATARRAFLERRVTRPGLVQSCAIYTGNVKGSSACAIRDTEE